VTHPLGALVEAGVKITLNPDDSLFFRETTVNQEMEHVANNFGYDDDVMRTFIVNAISASFAPDEIKLQLLEILNVN
jgi:adenosine deaminase